MIRTVKGDITKVTDVQAIVNAAKIAVRTVARFLQENPGQFDLAEWVLFDSHTESVYEAEVTLYIIYEFSLFESKQKAQKGEIIHGFIGCRCTEWYRG